MVCTLFDIDNQRNLALKLREEANNHPNKLLRDGWGEFIARYPWEWFVNLTFTIDVHPEAALKKFRLWASMLARSLYGPRWSKNGGLYWVVAIEYQKRGVIHFHALVIGQKTANKFSWMDRWHSMDEKTGFARIYDVNSVTGVSHYLSKYVPKDGQVFFSDNLPNLDSGLFPVS